MPRLPQLVPVPPSPGTTVPVPATPFRIGSGEGVELRLSDEGVADQHVAIMQRDDGYWLNPVRGVRPQPLLNGVYLTNASRLRDQDHLQIVPGVVYEFVSGERREGESDSDGATDEADSGRTFAKKQDPRRKTLAPLRPQTAAPTPARSATWLIALALLLLAAAAAFVLTRFTMRNGHLVPLAPADARLFDQQLNDANHRVERGSTLLDLGLGDAALQEFTHAISNLGTSRLRDNAWVQQRTGAVTMAVTDAYRTRGLEVPAVFGSAARSNVSSADALIARYPVEEFARRLSQAQQAFASRFGRQVTIAGRDLPEHVSLYGVGGAVDFRVDDLSEEQTQFLLSQLRAQHLRAVDYSSDPAVQDELHSTSATDLPGVVRNQKLHLHVDRYAEPGEHVGS